MFGRRNQSPQAVFQVRSSNEDITFLNYCLGQMGSAFVRTRWAGFFSPFGRVFQQDDAGLYSVVLNYASDERITRLMIEQLNLEIVSESKPSTWLPQPMNRCQITFEVQLNGRYQKFDLSVK